jgi:hypothetical protein
MKKLMLFMAVIFAVTFVNAQTKTEVKVSDLQKAITDHITANFAGYTINKAFKVDHKGVITYNVHISKAADKLTLEFDKDGNFVKKMAAQPKPATAPKAKPTEKAPAKAPAKSTKTGK